MTPDRWEQLPASIPNSKHNASVLTFASSALSGKLIAALHRRHLTLKVRKSNFGVCLPWSLLWLTFQDKDLKPANWDPLSSLSRAGVSAGMNHLSDGDVRQQLPIVNDKIVRERLSASDRSWQQCRMNIGCITQTPFRNTIWKLILCPIYRMLALERPYGWYHQPQNHFISLWVSLCDRGNNIFLFFFQVIWHLMLSQAAESASWAFSHSVILSCWDTGASSISVSEDGYKTTSMLRFAEEKCVEGGKAVSPFIHVVIPWHL